MVLSEILIKKSSLNIWENWNSNRKCYSMNCLDNVNLSLMIVATMQTGILDETVCIALALCLQIDISLIKLSLI